MSDICILAEGIGKQYQIGAVELRRTLREDFALAAARWSPLRLFRASGNAAKASSFWALRDVSFRVARGEVVGIIGRNGAGKSTLLKVLSRITLPSQGAIELTGRVGSLLEVGTGFHPELSGRENVYLNGAILGMSRSDIARKFDEIIAFSEVERFLDTPVKRYSSGMYMRLAFAVAAHLEPEILVVDEVLAVGDAEFQKKCLGKMEDVGKSGRTVLFVSHSMPAVSRLCQRTIVLHQGKVEFDGPTSAGVRHYLSNGKYRQAEQVWQGSHDVPGDNAARLVAARVLDCHRKVNELISISDLFYIEIDYEIMTTDVEVNATFHLVNERGVTLFASADFRGSQRLQSQGLVRSRCTIPGHFLAEGSFSVLVALVTYNPNILHAIAHDAIAFQVVDPCDGNGVRGPYAGTEWPGVVRPKLNWERSKC